MIVGTPGEAPRVPALRLVAGTLYVAAWPALLFVLAGEVRWVQGWLFAIWLLALYVTITAWMYVKDPALLAERRRKPPPPQTGTAPQAQQQAASDRRSVRLLFLGFAAWIVLMPLDARRFSWSPAFPVALQACGGVLLLASAFFLFRAFHDNTFLSGAVRVQSDRGQRVVDAGVYGFVRHPMYLGMLLMFAGTPLLLNSMAGLGVAVLMTAVLASRSTAEEHLLRHELAGYEEYRQKVRYRLVPFLW